MLFIEGARSRYINDSQWMVGKRREGGGFWHTSALVANTRSVVINCDPSCGHQTTYTNRPAVHPFLGLGLVKFSNESRPGSLRSLYHHISLLKKWLTVNYCTDIEGQFTRHSWVFATRTSAMADLISES
jgi:hypothetical protein